MALVAGAGVSGRGLLCGTSGLPGSLARDTEQRPQVSWGLVGPPSCLCVLMGQEAAYNLGARGPHRGTGRPGGLALSAPTRREPSPPSVLWLVRDGTFRSKLAVLNLGRPAPAGGTSLCPHLV